MSATFKLNDFEGPLDLLLYLIEKNKMSIDNIEISSITDQYLDYLAHADKDELEQTSEFIVMAATLIYLKSKMLLPKPKKSAEDEKEDEDPRHELMMKLLEYKKIKYVTEKLDERQQNSDIYCFRDTEAHLDIPDIKLNPDDILKDVSLDKLYEAFETILRQQKLVTPPSKQIDYDILKRDTYTVEEKSRYIMDLVKLRSEFSFSEICSIRMPKMELIVTFMAILELVHKKKILIYQKGPLEDIEIKGTGIDG